MGIDTEKIVNIAAGWSHSAIISNSGELFTFGWGLYHQLCSDRAHIIGTGLPGTGADLKYEACRQVLVGKRVKLESGQLVDELTSAIVLVDESLKRIAGSDDEKEKRYTDHPLHR